MPQGPRSRIVRRLPSRKVAAQVLAIVGVAALGACHARPAAGEKCPVNGQLVCAAADRALVCDSNAWVPVPCKGPRGCGRPAGAGAIEQCDDTLGAQGERCPSGPPLDYACTGDHADALVCREGRFDLWRHCRGPRGCEVGPAVGGSGVRSADASHDVADGAGVADGRSVRCDTSAGAPGDPCERRGSYACSTDAKTMLVCTGASLVAASSCRGPDGCHVDAATSKVDCDDTVAEVGDPCDEPRRITCAADHKSELVCAAAGASTLDAGAPPGESDGGAAQDAPDGSPAPPRAPAVAGRYEKKRECRRSDCSIGGSELFCD
jgi:hypothetical protein